MNKLSIKNLTITVGVVATLILLLLFMLTSNNNFKQHEYQEIIQLVEEIDIDMLKMRRSEKDFLMRLKDKYVEKHQAMRPKVDELVLKVDVLAKGVGQSWEKADIENSFQEYYGHFDRLVDQEHEIGIDEKSGLRGELRKAIHKVESVGNAQNDTQLLVHILMLRRHEKDFLLRKQLKYLDRHRAGIEVAKKHVEANSRRDSKKELLNGLNLYQKKFEMLVNGYQGLGLDAESGIRGEMRASVHHLEEVVESEIKRLREVAVTEDKALSTLTQIYFIIGSLSIIAIIALMVWQVVVRSRQAISVVDKLYQKVQVKDFTDMSSLFVEGRDEFAVLTQGTAKLGEQIGQMYSEMATAGAASERIKQALDVANAPVIVCDDSLKVIYQNDSFTELFKHRAANLSSVIPKLAAGDMLGQEVDDLNSKLGYSPSLGSLTGHAEYRIESCDLVFDIFATAIISDTGERLGLVLEWNDETDRLLRELEERRIANENASIRIALDCCDTNVMIADSEYTINYMNDAVKVMMKEAESDLQASLPNFDADNLMGQVIDVFHKNPAHQRGMLDGLTDIYRGRISSGRRTFDLIATPMFNDENERLGTVVEWDDITVRLEEEEKAKRIADENASIKLALDVCDTNVMMADSDYNISYMNQAVSEMMNVAEADLKEVLPDFNAGNLMGQNIDVFHRNPDHQRSMLAKLTQVYRTEIDVGRRTFALTATPIFNESKDRLGTVVEWSDRTAEVAIEQEMNTLIISANDGDLSKRIDLNGKSGFYKGVGEGLNNLLAGLEAFINDMGAIFGAIAKGDLSSNIDRHYKGQFEQIKDDANQGLTKLRGSLINIHQAAQTVGTSSNEVAQGTDDLSRRTESQASSLEETASSMEEITATVKQTAENASQSSQYAKDAKQRAESGGAVVNGAVNAMAEILKSSHQINDIIGVIDEIAFQTNLLALNAAVEAARAGEHGRGFAVVAGEVRTLSQRSAGAAKEIKDLIRDSVNKVESGSSLVNESGAVLTSIIEAVDKVAVMIDAVNHAAAEQTNGISQINQAISGMDEMTQQNAALVEQSSAASRSMSDEVRNMNQMIGSFNLGR